MCENAFKAKIVTGDYKDKQVLAKANFENVNFVSWPPTKFVIHLFLKDFYRNFDWKYDKCNMSFFKSRTLLIQAFQRPDLQCFQKLLGVNVQIYYKCHEGKITLLVIVVQI